MVNKVVLIGNLGRDPELFHTQSGQPVARISVATNEVWTKNGERQRRTEWHRVVVWGPRAESVAAQLRKGTPVYVEGRLCTRTFTNADNVEQMRTEIHSQRLMSLRSQSDGLRRCVVEHGSRAAGWLAFARRRRSPPALGRQVVTLAIIQVIE